MLTLAESLGVNYLFNSETTGYLQEGQRNHTAAPQTEHFYPMPVLYFSIVRQQIFILNRVH